MKKRILIIDDELDICLLLQSYLKRQSFDAHYEQNLKTGLQALSDLEPAVLILDNNLPDGLGVEQIPAIKASYPDLTLLIISAYSSLKQKAIDSGADAFISKPFNYASIMAYL
ncbi:response regulator [Arcticibacterium luteifluviistationis]|uniref:Response regulator n=1 Tax=Arcticibacterium luteifluviistationis TaxID=1784714 RepID=A0A2Z4GGR7_9BACT|nr:response regulator [Arcticibacterium luteifluviistationis]AWW00382.1 response regulator [Arcticibacterium luteifluviistationis]